MTDSGDRQDVAEALDADKIDDDRGVEEQIPGYPPDEPMGVDEYGVTDREDAVDEPIEERVARHRPEPLATEQERRADELDRQRRRAGERAGELDQDTAGQPRADGSLADDDDDLVLVEDHDHDTLTAEQGTGQQTAEEAAMHIEERP